MPFYLYHFVFHAIFGTFSCYNRDLNGYTNSITIHGDQFNNGCDLNLEGNNIESLVVDFTQYDCTDGVASVDVKQGDSSDKIVVEVKRGDSTAMVSYIEESNSELAVWKYHDIILNVI